jgi:hypothetical protein
VYLWDWFVYVVLLCIFVLLAKSFFLLAAIINQGSAWTQHWLCSEHMRQTFATSRLCSVVLWFQRMWNLGNGLIIFVVLCNHILIGANWSLLRSAESCRVERLVRFAFFVCWLMSIGPSVPSSFHFHTIVVLSYFGFVEDYYLSSHCPFTCLMYVRASHVDIIFRSQAAFSCSVLPMKSSLMTQAYIFVYCGAVIPWFCWTLLFIQALSIHCLMYVRASHVDIIFRSQAAFSCSVLPMKSSLMTQAYIFVYCGILSLKS